jgi:hypothetical protein
LRLNSHLRKTTSGAEAAAFPEWHVTGNEPGITRFKKLLFGNMDDDHNCAGRSKIHQMNVSQVVAGIFEVRTGSAVDVQTLDEMSDFVDEVGCGDWKIERKKVPPCRLV